MKKITIKEEWLIVTKTLPKRIRNEIIGAVTIYLVTGEEPEVSPKAKQFLDIVMDMVKNFEDKSEKMRSNRLKRGFCNNKCVTNVTTIVDTNDQQMCNKCDTKEKEEQEEYFPLPPLPPKPSISVISNKEELEEKEKHKEKSPKGDKEKVKRKYADEVRLTDAEYNKLVERFGLSGTLWMIEKLNAFKVSKGKTYKSDYGAILNWVVDRYEEYKSKQTTQQPNNGMDIYREAAARLARGELL